MKKEIGSHIIDRLNLQDIVEILSSKLSGSELNSVLLDVFNKRIQHENPASLLNKYERNKLVKPINVDVLKFKEEELNCYRILAQKGFEPLELSPVAQLGTSSVIATVDQKKVLSALRNTEVQADPTNAIALHYASLKKKGALKDETYNYSNISRVIRTQAFSNPNFTPHFSVLCLISCGKDSGSFNFEKEELLKHLSASYAICKDFYGLKTICFELIPMKGYDSQSQLITQCVSYIQAEHNDFKISVAKPDQENNYYYGFRIKLKVIINDIEYEIGDGGLLDWTQQLLANKKERMMTMGIGFQVLHQLTKQ